MIPKIQTGCSPAAPSVRHTKNVALHILLTLLVTGVFIAGAAAHRAVHAWKIANSTNINEGQTERKLALYELVDTNPPLVLAYFLLCVGVIILSLKRQYPQWAICIVTLSLVMPGLMYGIFCFLLCAKLQSG
ncbi:MAG: hypothetical protein N2C12_15935 [Planctomycetales bacterium]